ncbi:MAG: flagellar hook-length control protein FliK [Eubacterium sp.]|nr:flagellar hook-length control protein FliK [Eubacterium sp.]
MPIVSNGIQNSTDSPSSSVASSQPKAYRTGNTTVMLREGQTLKGVVSDVHSDQITLAMEDGTTFTGRLPDAGQYSIGQKAAFKIVSLDQNTIYMKAVSTSYLLDMEDTIDQALEEAGLPKSARNSDVVRSLLMNQQSISRENILSSIRLCATYPDADVNSVITLRRLGLPLTAENLAQFEQYEKNEHSLLDHFAQITDSVADLMNAIDTQVPRLSGQTAGQLLNLALSSPLTPEEQALKESQAAAAEAQTETAAEEEISESAKEALPEEAGAALSEEAEISSSPFSRMKQIFSSLTDGASAAKAALSESGLAKDYKIPFIHEQIGFSLSPEEREAFHSLLSDLPLPEELTTSLKEGTLTIRDFLTAVRQALPQMSTQQASGLLSSPSFQQLVKDQFLSNWTLSPEKLKQKGAVEELYQQISSQVDKLSHFSQDVFGKNLFENLQQQTTQTSQNLDFMKLLNDTYQYVQLPVKLQQQNAHGDLYVMTRKESLRRHPDSLKALLHLDMDHLGSLDIHIIRENTSITTKFFVDEKDTLALLEKNINLLQDALNEQGFSFSSEFSMKEKDFDLVNDFMNAEAPVGTIARYNFDLRA